MLKRMMFLLGLSLVLALPIPAWAPIGLSGNPYPPASGGRRPTLNRVIPQTVNPPFMYDPHHDLYEWKIKSHPDDPCYYDEFYGQWIGDCNLYLTAPGYSITVPNQIPR